MSKEWKKCATVDLEKHRQFQTARIELIHAPMAVYSIPSIHDVAKPEQLLRNSKNCLCAVAINRKESFIPMRFFDSASRRAREKKGGKQKNNVKPSALSRCVSSNESSISRRRPLSRNPVRPAARGSIKDLAKARVARAPREFVNRPLRALADRGINRQIRRERSSPINC